MKLPKLFRSLKNRLALLFFLITAGAILIVYAYVVPQLQSSLISEKQKTLESLSGVYTKPLRETMARGENNDQIDALVRRLGRRSGSRVTLIGIPRSSTGKREVRGKDLFVIADSRSIRTATRSKYEVVGKAIALDRPTKGTEQVDGEKFAQVARPISFENTVPWVVVFSNDLADVSDSVALISRDILVAGGLALLVALIAGYLVARAIARRAKLLEQAAEEVAAGRFTNPIPIGPEDELGKLAITFNEMQRRLRRLDQARKEFIANASHELRTPLFSLGGFVELLQDEELDSETREEFLQSIGEQVDRLTKLATNLLDLSKMDVGSLELKKQETDLAKLARSVAGEFRPAASLKNTMISLQVDGERSGVAVCDPQRVAQIVRILLDNALKHTPSETAVTVTTGQENGSAQIVVGDRGPGLSEDEQQHIFDRFYSGDAGKGTGLGLAIARELAEHMNGHLKVESKPGHTNFTLELPAS